MADQDNFKTQGTFTTQETFKPQVRETRTTQTTGGGMALLVGGLVVAVGFILWFVFGAVMPSSTTPVDSDTNNVTIQPPAAAPADSQPDAIAPATEAEPVEPVAPATDAVDPAPVTPDAADSAPVEPAPAD